jgi:hypothetical protein
MSRKQASKRRGRKKTVAVLGAAGVLSLAGGASAAIVGPATETPKDDTASRHVFTLSEEEIFDVSLGTFYVYDKENAARTHLAGPGNQGSGCKGSGGGCKGSGGGGCKGSGGGGCGGGGGGCKGAAAAAEAAAEVAAAAAAAVAAAVAADAASGLAASPSAEADRGRRVPSKICGAPEMARRCRRPWPMRCTAGRTRPAASVAFKTGRALLYAVALTRPAAFVPR